LKHAARKGAALLKIEALFSVVARAPLDSIATTARMGAGRKKGNHMKKIILCGAAALALSTAGATAKTQTVKIQFDDSCDSFTLTVDGSNIGLAGYDQSCDPGFGSGYIGKVKGHGKWADLGAILNKDVNDHWVIGLQYPLVTGGTYTFGFTGDGVDIGNDIISGTYSVVGTPSRGRRGTRSLTSMAKEAAARK
jgi:hypothetical protein